MNNNEEIVSDGFLFITRIPVPGGWIYNSFDKSNQMLHSVFVPYSTYIPDQTPKVLK